MTSSRRPYIGPSDVMSRPTPQQRWNAANPEVMAAISARGVIVRREKYRTDPEYRAKRCAQRRASYERNKEARLAAGREWAERNHEKVLRMAGERYRRTDARKRFAQRANRRVAQYGRPDDVLDWTSIGDGPWSCHNCGVACESWDHVEPLVLGGANRAMNLVPSCVQCNQLRTARTLRHRIPLIERCKRGHEFTPDNTRISPSQGVRRCKACARIYGRESYWRRRTVA